MATLYAMAGTIGAGKTTYAKKLSFEKKAKFYSIDLRVKQLGEPINTKEDYDRHYFAVRDAIAGEAHHALLSGQSVVLDFGGSVGHWEWLSSLASKTNSHIEIVHLIAPIEVRRQRVKARNLDPDAVFQFTDEEFNSMPQESATPNVEWPGLKITVVQN